MGETEKEMDWVNERAKCDVKKAFELLRAAVEKDVEQYEELSGLQIHYNLEFSSEPNWLFSVTRLNNMMKVTVFNRVNDQIEITFPTQTQQTLRALPIFTETGHCKFSIEGEEGESLFQWQLRRRVLGPLLFGS